LCSSSWLTTAAYLAPVRRNTPVMRAMARSAGALRNWAINQNKELAGTGVYAAHVGIDVSINQSVIPGFPVAPEQLSYLWIRIF